MPDTAFSTLYPDVLPHVPGCPTVIVEHEIKRAAQRLFEAARDWEVTLAAIAVAADTESVTIDPGTGREVVRVEKAWYDGKPIDPVLIEELDGLPDDWATHTGTPSRLVQISPQVQRLYPIPTDDALTGLVVRVSVKPSEAATGIPDDLMVRHRDTLIAGSKRKLMLYPNKPWSNPGLAQVEASIEAEGQGDANYNKATGDGKAVRRMRPNWC